MSDHAPGANGKRIAIDGVTQEARNRSQSDAQSQAQTVAAEAMTHRVSTLGLEDSAKYGGGLTAIDEQDLVDRILQMETSGRIDMSAFSGEDSHDDLEGRYGKDDVPDPGFENDDS